MMQNYVHSGYYDLFQPPFSLENKGYGSTIYCISTRFNVGLIMIPLVPSFYKDAIKIAKGNSSQIIYLIASDIGIAYSSDYYLTWYYITHQLKKQCKIFSKYMIENYVTSAFTADIIRSKNDTFTLSVPKSDTDVGTISITLTRLGVNAASPFACDVIINDTYKTILLVGEMNLKKADFLNSKCKIYDEIHIPFIRGIYGGLSYNQTLRNYPALVQYIRVNRFSSLDEFKYAKEKNIKIGEVYNDDFI